MRLIEFYERIETDPDIVGITATIAEKPDFDNVRVAFPKTNALVTIPVTTILDHAWEALRAVIVGERGTQVLHHVTRIVGYFSRIENWNKSKLGELADRRRGNYRLMEVAHAN